jgi:hypothetical protein
LPLPLSRQTRSIKEENRINHDLKRSTSLNEHDPRHSFSPLHSQSSESGNRFPVVSEQQSFFIRSPGQDGWVVLTGKADILHTQKIEARLSLEQSGDDPAIEIFVSEEAKHRR